MVHHRFSYLFLVAALVWGQTALAQFGGLKKAIKGAVEQKAIEKVEGQQSAGGQEKAKVQESRTQPKGPNFVQDDGITSEIHKQNVGKVLFSKQVIEREKERPDQFETEFTLSDPIHSRFYLARSIENECIKAGTECFSAHLKIHFVVNGEEVGAYDTLPDREWFSRWTTFRQESLTDEFKLGSSEINGFFQSNVVPRLKEGKNEIKVYVTFIGDASGNTKYEHKEPICEGTFTLVVKKGDVERFVKEKGPRLPEARMKNAKLEAEMLQAVRDANWKEEPLRVIILDNDWSYERNRLTGLIVGRHISAALLVKRPEGTCRLFYVGFEQENQGGDKYGKTRLSGVNASKGPYDVPCSIK